jgi:hypothetical protein
MRCKYLAPVCLLACCGLLWLSGCQSQAKSQADSAALSAAGDARDPGWAAPKITFAKTSHDFGVVPPNKLHKAQINFTNTGDARLKISKVSKCCGVLTKLAGNRKLPAEYAPGESGAVLLEWTSGSVPMVFKREFIVHSNDEANPATKLQMQAKIALKVTWEPKRMRLLLDEDYAGGRNITIKSVDGRPFSVKSFKSTGDCITADFDPSVEATKFVLEPKINTAKLHENLKGRILVGLTHPDGPTAPILFDVLSEYKMEPPLLLFFYAEPGVASTRKMSVLNNYKRDFDVDSLSSKTGAVGVRVLSKRKLTHGYQLELEVTPPAYEGEIKVQDELLLTLDNGEKLPIKCSVYFNKKGKSTTSAKTK